MKLESDPSGRVAPVLESHLLAAGDARVTVAPERGGLVTRFAVGDDEVLFLDEETLGDPARNVRGGIPVLFPYAGRLPGLPQHGFGRNRAWTPVEHQRDRLVLTLRDDEETRTTYPFAFAARQELRLADGRLEIRLAVTNPGERPLPVAPGWHPYFRVPDARKGEVRVHTDATRALDNRTGREVAVDGIDLRGPEVDLHLLDHRRPEVRIDRPERAPLVLRFTPGVLVVWTLAGRDFVCVEPWDAPAGAFPDRCRTVAPGATETVGFSIGPAPA